MADKIFKCTTLKDGETVLRHLLYYQLESGDDSTHVEIVIEADEMDTSSDMAEAKTLANAKASTYKTDWVASLSAAPTPEDSTGDVEGDVSL